MCGWIEERGFRLFPERNILLGQSSNCLTNLWSLLTVLSFLLSSLPVTSPGEPTSWKKTFKAKRFLGFLYLVPIFRESGHHCLSRLYKAIVLPHLDYCCCVWDPHHTTHIQRLENVQSLAARIVTNDWSTDTEVLKLRLH